MQQSRYGCDAIGVRAVAHATHLSSFAMHTQTHTHNITNDAQNIYHFARVHNCDSVKFDADIFAYCRLAFRCIT